MSAFPYNPNLVGFECLACEARVDPEHLVPVCPSCGRPLVARYDLERVRAEWSREQLSGSDLWRFATMLPFDPDFRDRKSVV